MQSLYFITMLLQSSCGSSERENSMHSSRCAFSSLQTQHGFTFSPEAGFFSGCAGWVTDLLISIGCASGGLGWSLRRGSGFWRARTCRDKGQRIEETHFGGVWISRAEGAFGGRRVQW